MEQRVLMVAVLQPGENVVATLKHLGKLLLHSKVGIGYFSCSSSEVCAQEKQKASRSFVVRCLARVQLGGVQHFRRPPMWSPELPLVTIVTSV